MALGKLLCVIIRYFIHGVVLMLSIANTVGGFH